MKLCVPFVVALSSVAVPASAFAPRAECLRAGPLTELSADIMGAGNGQSVSFVKRYHRGPGVHSNPIYYSGETDAKFTRIEGTWRFNNGFSGTFVMIRASGGAKAKARKREVAVSRSAKR